MKAKILVCEKEKEVLIYPLDEQYIAINEVIQGFLIGYSGKKEIIISAPQIIIEQNISINLLTSLSLVSQGDIIFKEWTTFYNNGDGSLYLKAGIESKANTGKVIFEDKNHKQIVNYGKGKIHIYYNPEQGTEEHKYHNPFAYFKFVEPMKATVSYMLVNNVQDLQDIKMFLHGNYALSRDIDVSETRYWNDGQGFEPLSIKDKKIPFSGNFDGNGYCITGLYINRPLEQDVGLFGIIAGQRSKYVFISNLTIKDAIINGDHYVGSLAGDAEFASFDKINITNVEIHSRDIAGGLLGTAKNIIITSPMINCSEGEHIHAHQYHGLLLGSAQDAEIYDGSCICESLAQQICVGYSENLIYQ